MIADIQGSAFPCSVIIYVPWMPPHTTSQLCLSRPWACVPCLQMATPTPAPSVLPTDAGRQGVPAQLQPSPPAATSLPAKSIVDTALQEQSRAPSAQPAGSQQSSQQFLTSTTPAAPSQEV